MPYAQQHYPFERQEEFKASFPADFIAEGLDQTRGWFYTLLVISTALFDEPPFKHLIVNGLVLAAYVIAIRRARGNRKWGEAKEARASLAFLSLLVLVRISFVYFYSLLLILLDYVSIYALFLRSLISMITY